MQEDSIGQISDQTRMLGLLELIYEKLSDFEHHELERRRKEKERIELHRRLLNKREHIEKLIRDFQKQFQRVMAIHEIARRTSLGWQNALLMNFASCVNMSQGAVRRQYYCFGWRWERNIRNETELLRKIKTIDDLIKLPGIGKKSIAKAKGEST